MESSRISEKERNKNNHNKLRGFRDIVRGVPRKSQKVVNEHELKFDVAILRLLSTH